MNPPGVNAQEFDEFRSYCTSWLRRDGFHHWYTDPVLDGNMIVMHTREGNAWGIKEYLLIVPMNGGYQIIIQGADRSAPSKRFYEQFFSRFDWAGHYLVCSIGDDARIAQKKTPVHKLFLDKPLAEDFIAQEIEPDKYKTWLRDDPNSFFTSSKGYSAALSHYVNYSYEQIEARLLDQPVPVPSTRVRRHLEIPEPSFVKLSKIEPLNRTIRKVAYAPGTKPDPSLENADGSLHTAASNGKIEMMALLLDSGADINALNKYGFTALHNAVQKNQIDIVRLLLERGADVHARSRHGFTALEFAARDGKVALARVLLAHGALMNSSPDQISQAHALRGAPSSSTKAGLIRRLAVWRKSS